MSLLQGLLAPLACVLVATAAQPIVIGLLRRAAVIDIPVQRSSHTVPTPRGGGIAVGLGLLVGLAVVDISAWLPLAVGLVLFFAIGLAEDVVGVPVATRLGAQLLTGVVVGLLLVHGAPALPLPAALVVAGAAVWITAYANAFNFMDGINGISAVQAALAGLAFGCIGLVTGDAPLTTVAGVILAGGLAFLPWNAVRARVFLGDVGSYCIGALIAVLAVHTLLRGVPVEAVLGPLALYVADTGATLLKRISRGASWTQPHRDHVYQRLCDAGWSHQAVSLATFGVGASVSGLGAVSLTAPTPMRIAADMAAVVVLGTYLAAPSLVARQAAVPALAGAR
jgi:UDP-GlcNAc:undecaprenyl-phosphate/decaprenyl-phosphate GlcNAc-1-phosphate transferase